jgi:hypothetical protein
MDIRALFLELVQCNQSIARPCIKLCIDHNKLIYVRSNEDKFHYTYMLNNSMFCEYINLDNLLFILDHYCNINNSSDCKKDVPVKFSVSFCSKELDIYGNIVLQILENIKLYYDNDNITISSKITYN